MLLGDVGNQLDIQDARAELERLRRSWSDGVSKDREQDERLRALADENEQLKLCLIALVRLLVAKGVLAGADVTEIVNVLDPPNLPESARRGAADAEPSTDDLLALAEAARRFGGRRSQRLVLRFHRRVKKPAPVLPLPPQHFSSLP
jgi:hypothetical protein